MRDSYLTEMFVLVLAGIGGILIYIYTWVSVIIGVGLILFDSYFVISNLKEQTIREYVKSTDKTGSEVKHEKG